MRSGTAIAGPAGPSTPPLDSVYSALYHVVKNGFVATPGTCERAAVGHIYSTTPVPYFSIWKLQIVNGKRWNAL